MDNVMSRNRKYTLAVFFALANTVALFFGFMAEDAYILGQGVILGMYGAANVLKGTKNAKDK